MAKYQYRLADPSEPFWDRFTQQFATEAFANTTIGAVLGGADWMLWNTFLAAIPALLIWMLTRYQIPQLARWIIAIAFVAFLPNAAYVVTDLIHLYGYLHSLGYSLEAVGILVPLYAAFVAWGLAAFAYCLAVTYRIVARSRGVNVARATVGVLVVASSFGIYLGRVIRLNSWDFVGRPMYVVEQSALMFTRPEALLYVTLVAAVCGAASLVLVRIALRSPLLAGGRKYSRA